MDFQFMRGAFGPRQSSQPRSSPSDATRGGAASPSTPPAVPTSPSLSQDAIRPAAKQKGPREGIYIFHSEVLKPGYSTYIREHTREQIAMENSRFAGGELPRKTQVDQQGLFTFHYDDGRIIPDPFKAKATLVGSWER